MTDFQNENPLEDGFNWEDFPNDDIDDIRVPADDAQSRTRRPFQRPWTLPERVLLLLALWIALGAALLSTFGHGTGLDAVRRYLRYGNPGDNANLYSYAASSYSRFASVGDALLVLTDSSLRLLSSNGAELWSQSVRMNAPTLSGNGSRVVAWDAGGSELYVFGETGPLLSLTADRGSAYLSARLNANGWLAVTTGRDGGKGVVSVYDAKMKLVFEFYSSRRFVVDAWPLNDNSHVAAVTLGQEDSVFISDVLYYRLDRKEPETHCAIPDALSFELVQRGTALTAVCDTCLAFLSADGVLNARYDFGDNWLRDYHLGGDGFAALYLSRYQSGGAGRIVTVDSSGNELGAVDVMEEVVDLSAAGRYVAALYTDRLVVYNLAMEVYATLSGAESVQGVVMRPDGSALLLGGSSARLFLP